MAGKRDIKTSLKLDGEDKFRKGMSDAADAIKVLNSEQKLAAAQFEATGDAEQYAADKARILKDKIAEQQKAVSAAEEAVKALKDQGFDPNSKAVQSWRTKLNNAKTTLTKMESELDKTESALNEQGDALDDATTDAGEYQAQLKRANLTPFKDSIAKATNAIKLLDSEQKLAEAQFKATGDSEKYAADKARILKEKIDQQKAVVKNAEDAIKAMTEQGVDPNSEAMMEWRTKLINAKTTLSNLERELQDVEGELDDQGKAFDDATTDAGEFKDQIDDMGVDTYKDNIAKATSAIKTLDSEQKLAEARFKATGDAEQYAADKARILKEKIAQQKTVVKNAEDAIKAMKEKGVDPNSEAMQEWRTKLNTAKTALYNMERELDDTEKELKENRTALDGATTDAGEFQDELEKIGKDVDFSATIEAIDNIRERLGQIVKAAGRAVKAVWSLEMGGAKWADELITNAQVADMDVETYQAWAYASEMVDTSVDSIISSYKKLNKSLDEPTDELLHSLNELSVRNLDWSTGQSRDTMEVFWDIIDALGQIDNKSRRDQLAMELLGKSFDDLNPLIQAGSERYKEYIEEGRLTAVSKENVEALGELDDANNRLNASLTQTKNNLLAEFAEPFEAVADSISTALQSFNDFIASAEGQAALADLKGALGGLADEISSTDWSTVMENAAGVIKRIADGLTWMINHKELVVGAIGAIAGGWAALTVSRDVLSVLQLLGKIKWAQIYKVSAGSGNGGIDFAQRVDSAGSGFSDKVSSAGSSFGQDVNTAGDTFAEKIKNAMKSGGKKVGKGVVSALGGAGNAALTAAPVALPAAVIYGTAKYNNWQKQAYAEQIGNYAKNVREATEGTDNAKLRSIGDEVERIESALTTNGGDIAAITEELKALQDVDLDGVLSDATLERYERFMSPENDLDMGEVQQLLQDMLAEMNTYVAEASTIGGDISGGVAEGMYARSGEVVAAAEWLGDAATRALRNKMMIQSPSKVMMGLGEYVSEGFAMGIEDNVRAVERATSRMVAATTRGVASDLASMGGGKAGGMARLVINVDGQQLADVITPIIDSNIGMTVQRRR